MLGTLATLGSVLIIATGAAGWVIMSLKAAIRAEGRTVVSALKHDSDDLQQLRADVAALRAVIETETAASDALVRSARRHLRAV